MKILKYKKILIEIFSIIVGTFFMAIAVDCLLLPNKLSSGGFSGISTILYYFLNWPIGVVTFALNVPLFICSFFKLGKTFVFKTIFSMLVYSIFLDKLDNIFIITQDKLLSSLYAGVFMGFGISLNFRAGSSTGGTDILAYLLNNKKVPLNLSNIILIFDGLIIVANVILFKNIEIGLYSILAIYISSKVIDIVFEGIYFSKAVYIISDKHKEISKEIIVELERGITGLKGKGMYTNKDKVVLLCIINQKEIPILKDIVKKIDKEAFVIISNVREVVGNGFK